MSGTTRVSPQSNELSEALAETAPDVIYDVVGRDTGAAAERYIVFLAQGADGLPEATLAHAERRGLTVKAMENHAIDYEHRETSRRADFLFRRE